MFLIHFSFKIQVNIVLFYSDCRNPIIDQLISEFYNALSSSGDPTEALQSLTSSLRQTEIASGNIFDLISVLTTANNEEKEILVSNGSSTWRDESSKNFTNTVLAFSSLLLNSTEAFWGSSSRVRAVDNIQSEVDQTLNLLAQFLIGKTYVLDYDNIGIEI